MADGVNAVRLSGSLLEIGPLRQTPAGIAMIEFRLMHTSELHEAGTLREVRAEVDMVAFEAQARLLAGRPLDAALTVEGFLCARSRRSNRLVVHAMNIEFSEGV